jgi:hypothetical protein
MSELDQLYPMSKSPKMYFTNKTEIIGTMYSVLALLLFCIFDSNTVNKITKIIWNCSGITFCRYIIVKPIL